MSGSSSEQESAPVVIQKGDIEKALEKQLLESSKQQFQTFQLQQQQQREFAGLQPDVLNLIRSELQSTQQALPTSTRESLLRGATDEEVRARTANEELLGIQLEQLRGGGVASQQDLSLINRSIEGQIQAGEEDINRFSGQALEQLREELAPSRGLRSTDTPIVDRGARVAEEALRQKSALSKGLRAQGAELALKFPLQRTQALAGVAGQQQSLQQGASSFQQQLRDQASQNRLALTGQIGQQGLGLATAVPLPSAVQAARPLVGQQSSGESAQGGICHGAAEVFGWYTPQWWNAFYWIWEGWQGEQAEQFRTFYRRNSRTVAAAMRRWPEARTVWTEFFVWAAKQGEDA